jgi:anti-sigma regulatory factor (Ser/Thr protein kinase)
MHEIMSPSIAPNTPREDSSFRHEALFYAGERDFVERTGSFIQESVRAGEPILVVVSKHKIDLLRSKLGRDAGRVRFADMADVGHNPARIIPAWRDFVAEHAGSGRRFRGVGEPIWAARSADELVECERHEALLNLAFAGAPAWWLACPYDTQTLPNTVLQEAERNHPVMNNGSHRPSALYRGLATVAKPFDLPLPDPPGHEELAFEAGSLGTLRTFVARLADEFGLTPPRRDDLVFVANEVATNSLVHGGGHGTLRIWPTEKTVVCEILDQGRIADPLAGRRRPSLEDGGGLGLWLANQLCDLVQMRSFSQGSVVRLHVSGA